MMLSLCLSFATASHAEANLYTVTYVYDGDTVKLRSLNANNPKGDFKLRLTEIDAPERNQSYGLKSRRALIKLCQGSGIIASAEIVATDKYHRALGRLQCNQVDASLYLAEQGLAWHNARYAGDFAVETAANNARRQKLGLWTDANPVAPWDWRREHAREQH